MRHHPVVAALADVVARHRLDTTALDAMIEARMAELEPGVLTAQAGWSLALATTGQAAVLAAQILDPHTDCEAAREAGALWGLARLIAAGRVSPMALPLASARRAARSLSITAFPAIAHATLARPMGRPVSNAGRRLRLVLASALGRI